MAKRPIREIFFWTHLIAGVAAGLVIVVMSVTGVLLTYEQQIIVWGDMNIYRAEDTSGSPVSVQEAAVSASAMQGGQPQSVVVRNAADAPYEVSFGRRGGSVFVDAYTGEALGKGNTEVRGFFSSMREWHRWVGMTGEGRATGAEITGVGNMIFLFLLFSGLYIWLPHTWRWRQLKNKLWFNPKAKSARARDYNWHHVFGFWTLIPLIAIVYTGATISYSWMSDFTFQAAGIEQPPRGPRGAGGGSRSGQQVVNVDIDALLANVQTQAGDWVSISIPPTVSGESLAMSINYSSGRDPKGAATWIVDTQSGEVIEKSGWEQQSAAAQLRTAMRFLHTGEYYGFWGQTIAGIVSLLSVLMVWTGFTLAYRRLLQPLFKRFLSKRADESATLSP